jgi:hypothetical protein
MGQHDASQLARSVFWSCGALPAAGPVEELKREFDEARVHQARPRKFFKAD